MIDCAIYKIVWANLCILCNTISMQINPQKVLINSKYVHIYIEVGVYKTHVRLMTLGSLGKCNHSKSSILNHSLCQLIHMSINCASVANIII